MHRLFQLGSMLKRISRSRWIFPTLLFCGYGLLYAFLKDRYLFTPDFSGTDSLHFTASYKYMLWKSIRAGVIPFWTDMIDGGFPLLAESQMGTFFLPYYFIFPFFTSFPHALAFLFCFHLFLLSIGLYLVLKELKITSFLSFLMSIIFAWNGSIMFRWVHLTVIQSFSFMPLLFWVYLKWDKSQKITYFFLIALIVNQMIFAGFIQLVFISLLGLSLYYLILNWPIKRNKTILFFCSLLLGLVLSLPQIFPTLQLTRYSNRSISSSYDFAVSVPFNLQNMCGFFSASCLGTPQNGTYSFNWQRDGIYWENTPYLGEMIGILIFISLLIISVKKKPLQAVPFLCLFVFLLLLALGKNSPLYFIFSIFPFSLFRTPPRYLLVAVFFLMLFVSIMLNYVMKKRVIFSIIIYLALIINCILLIRTAFNYHLFIDSKMVDESLNKQTMLKPKTHYFAYGVVEQWQKIFFKSGWNSKKSIDSYLFINQALLPNSNLIAGHSSFDVYTSLSIRRHQFLKSIIVSGLNLATNKSFEATQSAHLENILQLYNIDSILSFKPLYLTRFKEVQSLKHGVMELKTYQQKRVTPSPHFYIPKSVKNISNLEELETNMYSNSLSDDKSIAEGIPRMISQEDTQAKVEVNKSTDHTMKGTIVSENIVFIALRKNWYPDWRLYLDGKKQKLYKTNLVHMGFIVSPGNHTFELVYVPMSFILGCAVSFLTLLIVGIITLKTIKRSK